MQITVAHSPDADDFLLFWAVRHQQIDCQGLSFSFQALDTEALNRSAVRGEFDVTAISCAAYPAVADRYLVLPHGASVSRGYGPALVAPEARSLADLQGGRIGIPGMMTTAGSIVRSLLPQATFVELPLQPFSRVYEALENGEVDAAVLIHEGQLSYQARGLQLVLNIGRWWQEETGLALPLGINVIRRALGAECVAQVSSVLRQAIRYGVAHSEVIAAELAEMNRSRGADVNTTAAVQHYLSLYANCDSLELDKECREALFLLLQRITGHHFDGAIFAP